MLTRLTAENYRRFDELDLVFDDAQLIAVTGNNGAGKSTLVEMILYALFGHTRHGRSGLGGLPRWGEELAGTTVSLDLTLDGTDYRVSRRYDSGKSSATLSADGVVVAETPKEVTAQVSKLLGMDAKGFTHAVVAQQDELDGLVAEQPARRRQVLSRLLRLDAVAAARQAARDEVTAAQRTLATLGDAPDVAAATAEVATAAQRVDELAGSVDDAKAALAERDAELATLADAADAYQQAQQALARLDGRLEAGEGELAGLRRQRETLSIPDEPTAPPRGRDELADERRDLERRIAAAEAAEETAAYRYALRRDAANAKARIGDIDAWVDEHGGPAAVAEQRAAAEAELATADAELGRARDEENAARTARAQAQTAVDQVRAQLDGLEEVGAVCPTCQQEVTDTHRSDVHRHLEEALTRARDEAQAAEAALEAALEAAAAAQETRSAQEQRCRELERRQEDAERLGEERSGLAERLQSAEQQLNRAAAEPEDTDALHAALGRLAGEEADVEAYAEAVSQRQAALSRAGELDRAIAEAAERLEALQAERAEAAPSEATVAAFERRQAAAAAREEDATALAALQQEHAVATERLTAAKQRAEAAEQQAAQVRAEQEKVRVHGSAAALLGAAHQQLSTQLRPVLEGLMSDLLMRMSQGTYERVSLDESYNVTVESAGKLRPLAEFSGGEQKLIALAMRLALASLVAEQHGAQRAGFLVLDECFESQAAARRPAIIEALRELRGTYQQILYISHVDGLDDAADRIIELRRPTTDEPTVVEQY